MGNQITWENFSEHMHGSDGTKYPEVSSEMLQTFETLLSMGFPDDASFEAAKRHGKKVDKAVDWIITNDHKFKAKNTNMHTGNKQDEKHIIANNKVKELIKILHEKQKKIDTLQYTIDDQEQTTMQITNHNEEYVERCNSLQYENQTLQHEKQTYQRKCTDLENEKQMLASEKTEHIKQLQQKIRRHTQELEQLQNIMTDDYKQDKQDEKESRKIEELSSEIKIMKLQNNKLKDQLQQTTMGKGIESGFIKEEDFSNKKISPFRQQIFKNLFDDLFDELEEKYEDLDVYEEDSSECDSKDDIDKVINEETDTKPRFELLIDRIVYEFLFDLLMLSYKFMLKRKSKICQVVAKQLNIENNKEQSAEDIAGIMVHPQLQQQWEYYLKNKMDNVYGIIIDDIDRVIDDIFLEICNDNKYKNWMFLKTKFQKNVKQYIWATCEIGWIMILTKPELTFYPTSFRMFSNDNKNKYFYNPKDKHDLWTGSKTKYGAKILFFTMPAIVQKHFMNQQQEMQIIKGTLFAHNNEELMKYVMSDPEELLQM